MFTDVFNKKTGRRGRVYVCNGCRGRTRILKADAPLPSDWSEKTEAQYKDDGTLVRRRGLVINHYCFLCTHTDWLASINWLPRRAERLGRQPGAAGPDG